MNISIVAIGDELLIGQVIDTNSGDIARRFNPLGWRVNDVQVVGDDETQIVRALDLAFESSDVVITTGGLGPTKDDITKLAMCRYFGGTLQFDNAVLENVEKVMARRGRDMNELTRNQAMVPSSCEVIQNEVGTAPIMWWEREGKVLVAMPGVPFETRHMLDTAVIKRLVDRFPTDVCIEHRNVLVTGYSESQLAMTIADWEAALPEYLHLAYLPKPGLIRLRLDGMHHDKALLVTEINNHHAMLCRMLGNHVLADEDVPLEEILLREMLSRGLRLATAESCTGGNIAHLLTSVPGCSSVYMGGVVAYSNDIKKNLLLVSQSTLEARGAVSEEVVTQMAQGACTAMDAHCAIATSGIAGPDGATPGKPVGTVCIGIATPTNVISTICHFPGSRQRVIVAASMAALVLAIEQVRALPSGHHNV